MKQQGAARRSCGLAAASAVALLALLPPALAASAVGHVSVTILPATAAVRGVPAMTFGRASAGAVPASGSLILTGAPGTPLTLSLSTGDAARGPGAAIPFRVSAVAPGPLALDGSGVLRLGLAATLSLGRAQAPGAYHGTYAVTVDY